MKWFTEVFLKSFEIGTKRVSYKQGAIFEKYLDYVESDGNAEYYEKVVDGLSVQLQKSSVYNGSYIHNGRQKPLYRDEYYITIKENKVFKPCKLFVMPEPYIVSFKFN